MLGSVVFCDCRDFLSVGEGAFVLGDEENGETGGHLLWEIEQEVN